MKPVLYSYYRSSCSYRIRIALYLANLDFEYHAIHLVQEGGQQNKNEYQKLNPKGEVPFFANEEIQLSQSMAILQYLDEKYLNHRLFSKELARRCKCIELCEVINSGIQPIQNLRVLQELEKRYQIGGDEKASWCAHWIEAGFQALEKQLEKTSGTYSMGDEVSAVDLYVVPQMYNAHRFKLDMNKFPLLSKVNKNCLALPAFQKAGPSVQPDAPKAN